MKLKKEFLIISIWIVSQENKIKYLMQLKIENLILKYNSYLITKLP